MAAAAPPDVELIEEDAETPCAVRDCVTVHCLIGGDTLRFPPVWFAERVPALLGRYPELASAKQEYHLTAHGPAFCAELLAASPPPPRPKTLVDVFDLVAERRRRVRFLCRHSPQLEEEVHVLVSAMRTVATDHGLLSEPWDLFGYLAALENGDRTRARAIDRATAGNAQYARIVGDLIDIASRSLQSFR